MSVCIHERLDVDGGGRGKLIELIRDRWAPHARKEHGVRLMGLWATVGSTGAWPEVRLQWAMDDWAAFAAAQAAQLPMDEKDVYLGELSAEAVEYRKSGSATLLVPAAFSPDATRNRESGLADGVILHEDVTARPGRLADYHGALASEFVPLAASKGLRLVGCYSHALRPNAGINLWSFGGWDEWRSFMSAARGDAQLNAWNQRAREWLVDIDGFVMVSPPKGTLRT